MSGFGVYLALKNVSLQEYEVENELICPLTMKPFEDPVIVSTGETFERSAILEHFERNGTLHPLTGKVLENQAIIPNVTIKRLLHAITSKRQKQLKATLMWEKNDAASFISEVTGLSNLPFHAIDGATLINMNATELSSATGLSNEQSQVVIRAIAELLGSKCPYGIERMGKDLLKKGYEKQHGLNDEKIDLVESEQLIKKAAGLGNPVAKGLLLMEEKSVELKRKAFGYLQIAAKMSDNIALATIGDCFLKGCGTARNFDIGIRHLKLAANRGSAIAQLKLGLGYFRGQGLEKDSKQGLKLLRESARAGCATAKNFYGQTVLIDSEQKASEEMKEAFGYIISAAQQGHKAAQLNLARCYKDGIGVKADRAKAMEWYVKAAQRGNKLEKEEEIFSNGKAVRSLLSAAQIL